MSTELPNHIGLILDGNRRWAKDRKLPTLEGHRQGYNNLKTIAKHAINRGVKYVSAYIFSTENWSRTQEEVSYLMDLALNIALKDLDEIHEENIRVVFIGDLVDEQVSDKLKKAIADVEEKTKDNSKGTLALCFNYGGHREITQAVQSIIRSGIDAGDINEEVVAEHIYHPEVPAMDLIIRTSGEQRLSNFMLWRASYSEMIFVDKHWPAFEPADLDAAIDEYNNRCRRFGG